MEKYKIDSFLGGWFVGNFDPSLHRTDEVEVAIKPYKEGSREDRHHHRLATEYTAIVRGKAMMNNELYIEGDIVKINPYESTDFHALEDTLTLVVKIPGAKNDKYEGEYHG